MRATLEMDVKSVKAYFTVLGTADMISGNQRLIFTSGDLEVQIVGPRPELDDLVRALPAWPTENDNGN